MTREADGRDTRVKQAFYRLPVDVTCMHVHWRPHTALFVVLNARGSQRRVTGCRFLSAEGQAA